MRETPPHSGACRKAAIAFAKSGSIRPSTVFIGGLARSRSFFQANPAKSTCVISSSTVWGRQLQGDHRFLFLWSRPIPETSRTLLGFVDVRRVQIAQSGRDL